MDQSHASIHFFQINPKVKVEQGRKRLDMAKTVNKEITKTMKNEKNFQTTGVLPYPESFLRVNHVSLATLVMFK